MSKKSRSSPWEEVGRTVRYSLASNGRTVRLACLMLIAIITWQYWL